MPNESDFVKVFECGFNQIKGYSRLYEKRRQIVYEVILNLCNTGEVEYKADMLVYKIEQNNNTKTKLYHSEDY